MAAQQYQTGYTPLLSGDEESEMPLQEQDVMIHQVPEFDRKHWNHIENLDDFFTRVYLYHQRSGFLCMVMEDVLQLLQFVFVVMFSVFLMQCVDYNVLFANVHYNGTHKVTLHEAVIPASKCLNSIPPAVVICILVASFFWLLRLIKVVYNLSKYIEMKSFYIYALKITKADLENMTWHDIQLRLLDVQKEQQMCIHKQELTELDIYHRILRFKNYEVAMINKSLLPLRFDVPFIGDYVFLSTGLKYNLEFLLFWGTWSPFENYWHLRPDYKISQKRKELANYLADRILWVGIANLLLSPLIFLWQILYSFFRYAEIIKREPGTLGARRWSLYSRLYLRHFNELDHEFTARLSRGYLPATKYMDIFVSPAMVVFAKNIAFFAGSILAALIVLTVIDEDTLQVEHVLTIMTVCGGVVACCRVFIPDENLIYNPETLLGCVLGEVHYMPDHWRGNAHTVQVRSEFSQLFQSKVLYIVEELLSPIVTPLILIFWVRHKALDIVDFFRNFSVDVVGVGDVCSFAQMDVRKHGNPQWVRENRTEANQYAQSEDGKTELSLMHFTLTNPAWKPPADCSLFLQEIKEHAEEDVHSMNTCPDNPLLSSLHTVIPGYNSINVSGMRPSLLHTIGETSTFIPAPHTSMIRGGVSRTEGPLGNSGNGILSLLSNSGGNNRTDAGPTSMSLTQNPQSLALNNDRLASELNHTDMSVSALYIHELHRRRRLNGPTPTQLNDLRARALWNDSLPSIEEQTTKGPTKEHEVRGATTDSEEEVNIVDMPPSLVDIGSIPVSKST